LGILALGDNLTESESCRNKYHLQIIPIWHPAQQTEHHLSILTRTQDVAETLLPHSRPRL